MSQTVLITGGYGYLGGRLVQHLCSSGNWRVRLGTRTLRNPPPNWIGSAEQVEVDLNDPASLQKVCRGVTSIIHLAAMNEIDCGLRPEDAIIVNTLGTLRLARAAQVSGVSRLVYISTAHVYGKLVGEISEQKPTYPTHPYAYTHRAAEDIIFSESQKSNFSGIVLRLSNGFGAPASPEINRWTLVVNDLCRQAVTKGTLTLKSSGLQLRDFISLDDVCRAVEHFMYLAPNKLSDQLFNVGSGRTLSVFSIAGRIADRCHKTLGFRPEIIRPDPDPDEVVEAFSFKIDKLLNTGFVLTDKFDLEIDATLKLCHDFFE